MRWSGAGLEPRLWGAGSSQLFQWLAIGLAATAAELLLLSWLTTALNVSLWTASLGVKEAVLLARYLLMDRLTFGHRTFSPRRLWRFHVSYAASVGISWVVLNALVAGRLVRFEVAVVVGVVASMVWSLIMSFGWIWKPDAPLGWGERQTEDLSDESLGPGGLPTLVVVRQDDVHPETARYGG